MARKKKPQGRGKSKPSLDRDAIRRIIDLIGMPGIEEAQPIDALRKVVLEGRDPGGDLAWLAAYDPDEEMSSGAITLLHMVREEVLDSAVLVNRVVEAASPILIEATRDPAVSDERKYKLAAIFNLMGGTKSPEEFRALFKDFEATANHFNKEAAALINDQPENVERSLQVAGLLSGAKEQVLSAEHLKDALLLGLSLFERNKTAAAAILGAVVAIAIEHGKQDDEMLLVLEGIAQSGSERAAWCLDELGRWPSAGKVGEKARELAARMKSEGVQPKATILSEFSRGMVSGIDGSGSRSVSLFFRTPEGGLDALLLLLNDGVGMKYAIGQFEDADDLFDQFSASEEEVIYAPCAVAFARELVADTWAFHEELGKPLPGRFFIYRPYLGQEPIVPRRRKPNLGAYMLEAMTPSLELFEGSEELPKYRAYEQLWFSSDAAYRLLDELTADGKRELRTKQFDEYIEKVAPLERELLLSRMAANLEVESLAGRATKAVNRLAARTWLGLSEDVMPIHKVPFVRALGLLSAQAILTNLRMGHRTQAEANAAREEADRRLEEGLTGLDHDELAG